MNTASRMRIICDPFKKEIEYQWYDFNNEEYLEFDPENSKLASEELTHATIQNRAYEIVNVINKECNVGNVGLEIIFIGAENDYDDFCNVISNYYSEANIECIRDTHFYNTAGDVMPKIKKKFSDVKETLEKYGDTDGKIKELINKYSDAVKPSISLCMMGLYSAGKSAFINSIIGSEVLPSASDPTTAKVFKIYCDKKYQIRFLFDEKECVLIFEGATYKPSSNCDKEIIKKLQSIMEADTQRDEVFHMNRALDILNTYANAEHKISDIIEIRMPFDRTSLPTEMFDFVIYDTPGSNSDNNVRHFEVLKDSLDKQTNALPIFLTTPDTMDAEDNDKILNLIEEIGAALDTTNAIVVVNKADDIGPTELSQKREKCQSLRITKWKSTRIFFLSSLIAIASKKDNPDDKDEWLNKDMFDAYEDKGLKYSSDKRKLFEFNIVDKSKADDIAAYSDDQKTTHLYKNSGLESIEKEIVEYARKYALYNKCQQASDYLQAAIDLCAKNVEKAEEELNAELEHTKGLFNSKEKSLIDNLGNKKKAIADYNKEFQELIKEVWDEFVKRNNLQDSTDDKKIIQEKLQKAWKEFKETGKIGKKDNDWAILKMQLWVFGMCKDYFRTYTQETNTVIKDFWGKKSDQFKEECMKVIHDSDALTAEQKQMLKSVVLQKSNMSMYLPWLPFREIGVIRKKRFLFWKRKSEKFDIKRCCNELIKNFNDAIRTRNTDVISTNEKNFKDWTDRLINLLTEKLCDFNSDLSSCSQRIEAIEADIDSKKKCERMLNESKKYIDKLLDIQGGIDNG